MNSKAISQLPVLIAILVAVSGVAESTAADRPNVIVCMVADMGFSDPGCFGGEIHTPNFDRVEALRHGQP